MAQSAHCLRWGKLWYAAYSLSPARVHYVITAAVRICRPECSTTRVTLSPSQPGQCVSVLGGGAQAECDVLLSLEGDFAAFEDATDFSGKLLLRPSSCDDYAVCGERLTEEPSRWLIVDTAQVTNAGTECDKIGVAHEAFFKQGARCQSLLQSCLGSQIDDLYADDREAEATGRRPRYFVSHHGYGARFAADVRDLSAISVQFETPRQQKTVITMQLAADTLRYTISVARGVLISTTASPFEAQSGAGVLVVVVQNQGSIAGDVSAQVNCTHGRFAPIAAQSVSLPVAAQHVFRFALVALLESATQSWCTVELRDGLFRSTDARTVRIVVTERTDERGAQDGTLVDGAPDQSDSLRGSLASHPPPRPCGEFCRWLDPWCAISLLCLARLAEYAAILVAVSAYLALARTFPRCACCCLIPCMPAKRPPAR